MAGRRRPRRRKKKLSPTPLKEIPLVASSLEESLRDNTQLPEDASQPDFTRFDEGTSSEPPLAEDNQEIELQTTPAGLLQGLLTGRIALSWNLIFQLLLFALLIGYFLTVVLTFLQDNNRGVISSAKELEWFLAKAVHISIFFLVPILTLAITLGIRSRR